MSKLFVDKSFDFLGTTQFVDFSDPIFNHIWSHELTKSRKAMHEFRQRIKKLSIVDFSESSAYFCLSCRQLEDGTHRSWVLRDRGETGCKVFVGKTCYRYFNDAFKLMSLILSENKLKVDIEWAKVCRERKWGFIDKYVSCNKKSFLDIGGQAGVSSFLAWNRGAKPIISVEKRSEPAVVSESIKYFLGADITFICNDWLSIMKSFERSDIVSCMGLLHYFDFNTFLKVLTHFCEICNETLILELRLTEENASFRILGSQTLVSQPFLHTFVESRGFSLLAKEDHTKFSNVGGKRELWIFKRK